MTHATAAPSGSAAAKRMTLVSGHPSACSASHVAAVGAPARHSSKKFPPDAPGFHRCEQLKSELLPGKSVTLETSTVSETVVSFVPQAAGSYLVIGTYDLSTKARPQRHVLSAPLAVKIDK